MEFKPPKSGADSALLSQEFLNCLLDYLCLGDTLLPALFLKCFRQLLWEICRNSTISFLIVSLLYSR